VKLLGRAMVFLHQLMVLGDGGRRAGRELEGLEGEGALRSLGDTNWNIMSSELV